MTRARIATTLLALLALSVPAGLAQDAPLSIEMDDRAAALDRVDRLMGLLEELRAQIDRTAFDAGALAFELAFDDAETIAAWVREHVAYEPYAGLLRGADGTLMARAGNALDQALLLAMLLGDAGYEVRIARATLEDTDARALVALAAGPRPDAPPLGDVDAMRDILSRLDEVLDVDEASLLADLEATVNPEPVPAGPLVDEVASLAGGIETALARAGVTVGDAEAPLRAARDYVWVEHRLSPNDPWTPAHPTGLEPPATLEAEGILDSEIPSELQHRVRIEVEIEQKMGDELLRHTLMDPWERPSANLVGELITYANAPDGFQPGPLSDFRVDAVVEGTNFYAPMLRGAVAEGGEFFDLDGNVVPPLAAVNQAAGVVRNVGRGFESAAGGLAGLGGSEEEAGDPDDFRTLTGQWIDVVLIAPGGEETRYRREVLDRIGAENRAAGLTTVAADAPEPTLALLRQHRIMVAPGEVPAGYLLDQAIGRILEVRPLLEYVVQRMVDPAAAPPLLADDVRDATNLDHLMTFELFDRALAGLDAGPGYRHAPAVLAIGEALRGTPEDATVVHGIDIVANPRTVLDGDGDPDAPAALRRGVWETVLERELVTEADPEADPTVRAAADLARGPFRILSPDAADEVAGLDLDAEAAANVTADLGRGYLVAVPETAAAGGAAWWRIDPATGAALGVTADGRGQATAEYLTQMADVSLTIMFSIKSLADCERKADGLAQACCLLEAHLTNVAGLGIGGVLGKLGGSASGLLWTMSSGVTGLPLSKGMGLDCSEML